MRSFLFKATWMWVGFIVLAVINGVLRDTVYLPQLGPFWGRIVGTVVLLVVIALAMYLFLRRNRTGLTRSRLVIVGLLWLALSLFFEFAVAHWVMEEDWSMILAQYAVTEGRLRVLVRLLELAGPFVLGGRLVAGAAAPPAASDAQAAAPAGTDAGA